MNIANLIKLYGPIGLLNEGFTRKRAWSIAKLNNYSTSRKTSISDATPYVRICEEASNNEAIFLKFRRCSEYRLILEHVSKKFGKKYLAEAKKNPNALNYFLKMKIQDSIGKPFTSRFRGIGKTSPTTLRYLKVVTDLEFLFGNLNNFIISEIGIGFGGQCQAISSNFPLKKYLAYDLTPVLNLSKKFLEKTSKFDGVEFIDGTNPRVCSSDLLISNYAFSELTREVQDVYLKNVVLNAKRGYITWNELSYKELGGYSILELLSLIPGSKALPEVPLTFANNVILVWGINDSGSK